MLMDGARIFAVWGQSQEHRGQDKWQQGICPWYLGACGGAAGGRVQGTGQRGGGCPPAPPPASAAHAPTKNCKNNEHAIIKNSQ